MYVGGTPLADKHGGWGKSMPCPEFLHTLADVFNAVANAGFTIGQVVEDGEDGTSDVLRV